MMVFLFGQPPDFVGKGQRSGKVRKPVDPLQARDAVFFRPSPTPVFAAYNVRFPPPSPPAHPPGMLCSSCFVIGSFNSFVTHGLIVKSTTY